MFAAFAISETEIDVFFNRFLTDFLTLGKKSAIIVAFETVAYATIL